MASDDNPRPAPPVALTISGSDPSGGAGLQADLKTFHRHRVYGAAVVTLVTVQNTRGVDAVETLSGDLVARQIDAVVSDIPPAAAKTGSLGSAEVVRAVADRAAAFRFQLVVDPVMVSKHGALLVDDDAVAAHRDALLPHAALATPNVREAARLLGRELGDLDGVKRAAADLLELGPAAVLVKGCLDDDDPRDLVDVLATREGLVRFIVHRRVRDARTHGSGCTLSAAVTARLALGEPLQAAVEKAVHFVVAAIESAPALGGGIGPLDHFADPAP